MHSSDKAINVENLRFRIPGTERDLIEGLSFSVSKGETVLLNSSEPGLTSWIIRLLFGENHSYSGRIEIGGTELTAVKDGELSRLRRSIGIVSESVPLLEDRDVWANVVLPLELGGGLDGAGRHAVERLLREVQLIDRRTAKPSQLGVSDRSKAQIVRALVREPQILLLDEPTMALNDVHCAEVASILISQGMRGMTIVIGSADTRLVNLLPHARSITVSELPISAL